MLLTTFSYSYIRWFHKKLSRQEAEDMLKRVQIEGAFLVRKSEQNEDAFAISFR